jgi:hypothetical protein
MANPEHLQILEQGVELWNAWRHDNKAITPDLGGTNLSEANLSKVDFTRVNLFSAKLIGASLAEAQLTHASLIETDLTRADLNEANIYGANLTWTSLTNAHLTSAILVHTQFIGVDLTGADLSRAMLFETVFSNTNLTAVRGLETCDHGGPSTLDHRTLAKSGLLPLTFLRGCGLPDALIDYLPSLLGEPIRYDSLFISYASQDQAFAERLYADLQNKGVRCWYAPEDMKIGDEFRSRIDASIHLQDRLLLILSEHSIKSRWVQKEVETYHLKNPGLKAHALVGCHAGGKLA